MTTVAVVIPFYNSDGTFPDTLKSVMSQTRKPDEIVVVDDGSDPDKARTLLDLPPQVRVLRMEVNSGIGPARQFARSAVQSEWIAYCDSDDVWLPEKLERQLAMVAANPELDAVHCGTAVSSHGKVVATYTGKPALLTPELILSGGQTIPSCLLIRRDALDAVGGWTSERYLLEDWDLEIRLVLAGVRVGFLPEALVMFRRDGQGNVTSDPWRDLLIQLACIDRHRKAMTEKMGPDHVNRMRLRSLAQFAWGLPKWPGRIVRAGIWMMEPRPRSTTSLLPS